MKVGIYYGSETGNSEMLCEDIEAELGDGFDCDIQSLADVDPSAMEKDAFYIIVTSTYGNGDLPSTALPFEEALTEGKPDLNGIRFAIFGLGDMVFAETFAHGSMKLAEMMKAQGATQVGERGIHDASGIEMPEDIALPWVKGIMGLMDAEQAA
ncbi:flavodoxin domain-containing protein [Tateyamaria omphalii]|uniref:flavodoxin domain-containing protein n=1 Tax=Tateyamaria omphalii TaxID=299262 RepID=UPI001C99E7B2|nr:flavodoxin domain-containing protein [Tateyamaria omphalii]MBY5934595.1 flavodoxin domain-containing protein [Tateyamaria omphalii]